MPRRARLLPLIASVALLAGCSLFDSDPAPTPSLEPTAPGDRQPQEPGPPAATPVPPGTVYHLTWTPVDPLESLQAVELASPFAEFLDGEPLWRLYVVDGESAEPRLLLETVRWLQEPAWSNDGDSLSMSFNTRVEGPDTWARGYQQVDVATGVTNWDILTDLTSGYALSPDGTRFVVKGSTGRPFNRGPLHLLKPGGETLLLETFTAEDFHEWSPDGDYFIASGYAGPILTPQERSRDYYLIGPGAGDVVLLGRSTFDRNLNTAWSPDGSLVAFTEGEDLIVFDVAARRRTSLHLGAGVVIRTEPTWSVDGRFIALDDGVVDVAAGRVVRAPSPGPPEPTAPPVRASAVSPDGTKLAWAESIFTSDCEGLQSSRALLRDVDTGQDTVLFDCGAEVYIGVDWLDAQHLLLRSADCDQCEPQYFGATLVSFPGPVLIPLTEGQESRADYAVSPDRSRLIVGGDRLRLYDASGALLRVIEPPAGYRVVGLTWSPDGSRFAYLLEPSGANLP